VNRLADIVKGDSRHNMIGTHDFRQTATTVFRAAALAVLLAATALSANGPAPPGPIRIGVIGPLTGSNQSAGVGQLNAVRLAAEEFNKMGGAHGRLVEVIEADDQGRPLQSAAGVDQLLRGGAVAVLGAINSSCTLAIMEPCARARVPLLTSSSTATQVTALDNKWVFRCIESDYFRMAELSRYLTEELSLRRIGILYDNDDFGRGLMADFTRSLERHNLELAYAQPFRRDQADFSAELQEIQRQGIEALGLFGITPDNIRIATLVREQRLPVQLFAPDVTERYLTSWKNLEGLVATDSYFLLQEKPAARLFAARYKTRFETAAGPHAGRAYDAACILLQAIRRTPDPRREALRDAISATENFPGVTGDFNFKANGDVLKKIQIVAIHNGAFVPAQEWRVRSGYQRWILILIPSLLLLFVVANWIVGRVRRAIRKRIQERALREFKPIKVNPYIVGNPIREKEMFFGREDDFHFILKNIRREDSGVCIVLCGERRSGKTSILYQILNGRLGADVLPVLIDLQLYGNCPDTVSFYNRVARDVAEGLRKRGATLPPVGAGNGQESFEELLEAAIRRFAGRKFVFLLDEYEILETLIDQGALHASTVDCLSALLDRHPELSFVLTGSMRLEDRRKPYWQHLIAKSLYRKISFLTPRDTQRLITEPLKNLVFHADGVPERIFRLTAGQPFYTQAVCMNVVDHLNEVGHNLVTIDDLAAVVVQLIENPLPQMLYFWDSFSFSEKLVLSLLADGLTTTGGEAVDAEGLLAHAAGLQLPIQQDLQTVQTLLEALFTREVVNKKGRQFQFRIDLLREWIHRDHSPWQIIGENQNR